MIYVFKIKVIKLNLYFKINTINTQKTLKAKALRIVKSKSCLFPLTRSFSVLVLEHL